MELNSGDKMSSAQKEAVEQLKNWIRLQIQQNNNVPRMLDVVRYANKNIRPKLNRKQISSIVRLNKNFQQVMPQQRVAKRAGKYRPIITNTLGYMHGDIGFFSTNANYSTPITFRAGFLVLVDILSKFVYLEILRKNRKAEAIIAALERIFKRHKKLHNYPIRGLSFDLEGSVMSKKVQQFLANHHIKFTSFKLSSSKAKFAENAIKLVRQKIDVLEKHHHYKMPWWKLLPDVEIMLNHRPIVINNAVLPFTPSEINESNVQQYLTALQLRSPVHYFSQFNVDPRVVQFKYKIGDFVKAKTIVTSSSVLGEKRSTHQLTEETFLIVYQKPYINRNSEISCSYLCKDIKTEFVHEFNEEDLVIAEPTWI